MPKPSFLTLWNNYPMAEQAEFFRSIGWDDLIGNPVWENTCAMRMSVCLAHAGVSVTSSAGMKVLKGPLRGKSIETRQATLSNKLRRMWGAPVELNPRTGMGEIAGKDGVISFFRLRDYNVGGALGGHIDLLDGRYLVRRNVQGRVISRLQVNAIKWNDVLGDAESIWFWEMPR